MIKKWLAALTCGIVAVSSLTITASAEPESNTQKLPFELKAPTNVSIRWLEGNDSPTTIAAAYSMDTGMNDWLSSAADDPDKAQETLNEYQLDELWVHGQADWAIDDPENGWHHTEYWDGIYSNEGFGIGYDKEGNIRTGVWDATEITADPQTINEAWLMRGVTVHEKSTDPADNVDWYGNEFIPGLKNQLKEDQYTLITIDEETGEKMVSIDYTKHTVYIRIRWAVNTRSKDGEKTTVILSDWSEAASYGKDAETSFTPYTAETLPAPVITDLHYIDEEFNNFPQIACTLTVPDDLAKNLTIITTNGGTIYPEWESRIPGGEWIGLQGDFTVTSGEMIIALQNLAEAEKSIQKDTPIELRCRYYCSQTVNGEDLEPIYSPYSEILTFGSQEMSVTPASNPTDTTDTSEISKASRSSAPEQESEASKCSLCGFCPQPLGLCIFIWIAIAVAIIIIVVVIIVIIKKKKKKT